MHYGFRTGKMLTLGWLGSRERQEGYPSFQYFLKKHVPSVPLPLTGVHIPYFPTVHIVSL